jgi:hypothetical protein
MSFNVDKIRVTLTINAEFSTGAHDVSFEYDPPDDDPLTLAALAKWREIRAQEQQKLALGPPADVFIL